MPDQFKCTYSRLTTADSGRRSTSTIQVGVFHTTENSDNTSVLSVAEWQQNPANQSSYNVLFGTQGDTARSNDDDYIPWAAMAIGNRIGLHGSAIGRASRSRQDWLKFPKQIESMAKWAADLHLRYGLPLVWLSPEEVRSGKKGFCGHLEISLAFRESDHTDPGKGFPKDVILSRAKEIAYPKPLKKGAELEDILNKLEEIKVQNETILRQLGLPGGWPQSGKRTLMDLTSAIAEKQGVPNTYDTLS